MRCSRMKWLTLRGVIMPRELLHASRSHCTSITHSSTGWCDDFNCSKSWRRTPTEHVSPAAGERICSHSPGWR